MKKTALIATLALLQSENTSAVQLSSETSHQHKLSVHSEGIFGRMIEQATAGETLAEERHAASERKAQQLAEAQNQYDKEVADQEREEAAAKKKAEDEAEQAAYEAAKSSPSARMMNAANDAASSINMSEIEANI